MVGFSSAGRRYTYMTHRAAAPCNLALIRKTRRPRQAPGVDDPIDMLLGFRKSFVLPDLEQGGGLLSSRRFRGTRIETRARHLAYFLVDIHVLGFLCTR
jgi:hypothetical protein